MYKAKREAILHQNSASCSVYDFGGIGVIDGADISIHGRYPENGFAVNAKSDLVIRIISGSGKLITGDCEAILSPGDVAFIERAEAYCFEGKNLELFMACTPAWSPKQYRVMK